MLDLVGLWVGWKPSQSILVLNHTESVFLEITHFWLLCVAKALRPSQQRTPQMWSNDKAQCFKMSAYIIFSLMYSGWASCLKRATRRAASGRLNERYIETQTQIPRGEEEEKYLQTDIASTSLPSWVRARFRSTWWCIKNTEHLFHPHPTSNHQTISKTCDVDSQEILWRV